MNHPQRLMAALAACLALLGASKQAAAQEYPQKRILLVVPAAVGGIADVFARVIAARLSATFGQPVVVDNKAGGAGIIGSSFVAKEPPDGYTLVMGYLGSHGVSNT